MAQGDESPEEVLAQAEEAFWAKDWEAAHRRYAELLSLEGTSLDFQVRYAATLLHDSRLRPEGIQRLAALTDQGLLTPEGWYWWGRALLLQGEGAEAGDALQMALSLADKKAPWRESCELAFRQSQVLPNSFELRQGLDRFDVVDVPKSSFYRYVQWDVPGVRVMLAPEELLSKHDRKVQLNAPVTFWRGHREVIYHSYGPKVGQSGLDLWLGRLDDEGEFSERERLPDWVNSSDDEVNPVWDNLGQTLYFASNRPGTVGGMDLYAVKFANGQWEQPKSMGPLYNSVHDDWAFYPGGDMHSSWLVTSREAAYGGVEVWEVQPNGPPSAPVLLTTRWEVDGQVIPGTLTLTDAETDRSLAQIELGVPTGTWDLTVGSGQVIRYQFVSHNGEVMEGTYALPDVDEAAALTQRMVMTIVDGRPFLDARPLSSEAKSMRDLRWGWNLVTDEPVVPEVRPWTDEELVSEDVPRNGEAPSRRVIQFQSFPWWTEIQKEERALAANVLTTHVPNAEIVIPSARDFVDLKAYREALEQATVQLNEVSTQAAMALAAVEVLQNETSWDQALRSALYRASDLWPPGSINVEEVGRKAQRKWAEAGTLYDSGLLPEVKDKESLVGDGSWVRKPWENGEVAKLASRRTQLKSAEDGGLRLVWALSHQPDAGETWETRWQDPVAWNFLEANRAWESGELSSIEALNEARTRLSILDSMEPTPEWTSAMRAVQLRTWRTWAVELSEKMSASPYAEVENTSAGSPLRGNAVQNFEQETSPSEAEGQVNTNHNAGAAGASLEAQEKLKEEWEAHWALHLLTMQNISEEVDEGSGLVAETGAKDAPGSSASVSWKSDYVNWLSECAKVSWQPRDMLASAETHWVGKLKDDKARASLVSSVAKVDNEFGKQRTEWLEKIRTKLASSVTPQEASGLLETAWLLLAWSNESSWGGRSPDVVFALSDHWTAAEEAEMKALSVVWAKQLQQEQVQVAQAETSAQDLQVASNRSDEPGNADPFVAERDGTVDNLPGGRTEPEVSSLRVGDRGVHLGWFRNKPQLPALPAGGRLESQEGSQGLVRWVLVMPSEVNSGQMADLTSWLAKSNVVDAYDVHWQGTEWSRDPHVDPRGREGSGPDAAARRNNVETLEIRNDNELDGKAQRPEVENPAEPRDPDENARPEARWGGDELWKHGAPVELGNLIGEWYAVQVGAFRGEPEKEWIEMAGERLVYEPFPDGLARWYAGVRQDEASARDRRQELVKFAPFQDAFVVRLRNGEREVIRPGEGSAADEADDAELARQELPEGGIDISEEPAEPRQALETVPGQADDTEDDSQEAARVAGILQKEATNEAGDAQSESNDGAIMKAEKAPAEVYPSRERAAELALQATRANEVNRPRSWHIDIAKYYGTVPSKDVASLLFRAADWGVKSVEIFGQTTYYSKSFNDLGQAEEVLESVRREGFLNARLVKEE
ncbi:MAG: hypothetical protein ACPHBR_08495 [Flavobacteriales bacterium]